MVTRKMHRYQTNKIGRPKKMNPLYKYPHKSLGGIPMKCENGRIFYAQYVPHNYNKVVVRKNIVLDQEEGDFVRRHIYETRFNISSEMESNDDRRKREYKEWIERFI